MRGETSRAKSGRRFTPISRSASPKTLQLQERDTPSLSSEETDETDGMKEHAVAQTLGEVSGVVVRQKLQVGEVVAQAIFGVPFESKNRYKVHLLPTNKVVKNAPDDPDGWEPKAEELEALDTFLFAKEESGCFSRTCLTWLGCGSLRPLRMRFTVAEDSGDVYVIDRPFKLGGGCCMPLEMNLDYTAGEGGPVRIGRVREDFEPYLGRCFSACCLATTYTDIDRALPDGSFETRYSLRTNTSCCGRVNNCCGATCFKNDAVYDVLDTKGEIVAHLQRTYGGGKGAFCKMCWDVSQYVLEFPRDSTPEDRMLLITGLFQVEYQLFEAQKNE